jgi:hypothetical protein
MLGYGQVWCGSIAILLHGWVENVVLRPLDKKYYSYLCDSGERLLVSTEGEYGRTKDEEAFKPCSSLVSFTSL